MKKLVFLPLFIFIFSKFQKQIKEDSLIQQHKQ